MRDSSVVPLVGEQRLRRGGGRVGDRVSAPGSAVQVELVRGAAREPRGGHRRLHVRQAQAALHVAHAGGADDEVGHKEEVARDEGVEDSAEGQAGGQVLREWGERRGGISKYIK